MASGLRIGYNREERVRRSDEWGKGGAILLVEDDLACARLIARALRFGPTVVTAHSLEEAEAKLAEEHEYLGFVIDIGLPSGDEGLVFLERVRARFPGRPALVMSGSHEREHVNRAQKLGASYALKPMDRECLEVLLISALAASGRYDREQLARVLTRFALAWRLTPAEAAVLMAAAARVPKADLHVHLGRGESAVRHDTSEIIRKSGQASLAAAVIYVLSEGAK